MVGTVEAEVVGKPKGKGPKPGRPEDVTVRMPLSLVSRARVLAAHRGTSVGAMLAELVGPAFEKAYAQMLRDLGAGNER